MSEESAGEAKGAAEEGTGLPGLRSWGAVYAFVVAVFVVYVVALFVLPKVVA